MGTLSVQNNMIAYFSTEGTTTCVFTVSGRMMTLKEQHWLSPVHARHHADAIRNMPTTAGLTGIPC